MNGLRIVKYICNNCEKEMYLDENTLKENEGAVCCPFCQDGYFVTASDIMEGGNYVLIYKEDFKENLLNRICEYYNFSYFIIESNELHLLVDRIEYNIESFDKALEILLPIMENTNKDLFETGDVEDKFNTWTESEINFIKSLSIDILSIQEDLIEGCYYGQSFKINLLTKQDEYNTLSDIECEEVIKYYKNLKE